MSTLRDAAVSPAPNAVPAPAAHPAASAACAWAGRSRALAAAGDIRLAVHTQWAADVATLHCLLWESGLTDVEDPAAQLDAVGHVVHEAFARAGEAPRDAITLVSWARATLADAFGAPVDALLGGRLSGLEHLEGLGTLPNDSPRTAYGGDVLVRVLGEVARDCSTVSRAMTAAGLDTDAADQLRRAVLAIFEVFLVGRTAAEGKSPSVVDLRWELAVAALDGRPFDGLAPVALAEQLLSAVEPTQRAELRARFEGLW